MADYTPPLRDIRFVLDAVLKVKDRWSQWPGLAEVVDGETADAILEEAGKLCAQELAPLNRNSDEEGCHWHAGEVTTPQGFRQAYQAFAEGGWVGVGGDPEYGGMGMPKVLTAQVEEMMHASCLAFGLYPMLSAGACLALHAHGSEALKQAYLPNLYSGQWAGSMCLTEPHAGTDLGLIRTRAEPQADGSYRVTGTKIFITAGEHDLTENIIHLVLAKLPDAPAGSRGISLFLVPKILVDEAGALGARNAVACGSLEHKMGIKGAATCVMNFDGAVGYLVGEVNKGLAAMFTMMNYERLGVGIQGLGSSERSYQNALAYARERLQSRSPAGIQQAAKNADPIIVHPDVRRMLLTMKALNEGGRLFSSYVALQLDTAKYSPEPAERERAEALVALLTPVAKGFLTDLGLELCVAGQQVFGGHGYIREWGQEQLVRDVRITQIYEGTNGIQALDLVGRKLAGSRGALYRPFSEEVHGYLTSLPADNEFAVPLRQALDQLDGATEWLLQAGASDPHELGAASVDYLHLFGYVAYAYLWARAAAAAAEQDAAFAEAKLATARFYFARLLPRTLSLAAAVRSGAQPLYALAEEAF